MFVFYDFFFIMYVTVKIPTKIPLGTKLHEFFNLD